MPFEEERSREELSYVVNVLCPVVKDKIFPETLCDFENYGFGITYESIPSRTELTKALGGNEAEIKIY